MMEPHQQYEAVLEKAIHGNAMDVLSQPEQYRQICEAINYLIIHRFDYLIQLLYRMDVHENKLKEMLQQQHQSDAAPILAQLIIERQAQKIKTRQQFSSRADNVSDEEKW